MLRCCLCVYISRSVTLWSSCRALMCGAATQAAITSSALCLIYSQTLIRDMLINTLWCTSLPLWLRARTNTFTIAALQPGHDLAHTMLRAVKAAGSRRRCCTLCSIRVAACSTRSIWRVFVPQETPGIRRLGGVFSFNKQTERGANKGCLHHSGNVWHVWYALIHRQHLDIAFSGAPPCIYKLRGKILFFLNVAESPYLSLVLDIYMALLCISHFNPPKSAQLVSYPFLVFDKIPGVIQFSGVTRWIVQLLHTNKVRGSSPRPFKKENLHFKDMPVTWLHGPTKQLTNSCIHKFNHMSRGTWRHFRSHRKVSVSYTYNIKSLT